MAGERRIAGQAEDPVDPVRAAPVEHLRARIVTVGAQQNLDPGPMGTDGADKTAHKTAKLHPAWPLAGAQQGGNKAAFPVKDDDRLEAVIVIVGIEQAQLLGAVHPIEGVVDIEHEARWHRPKRAAILFRQGPPEAQ